MLFDVQELCDRMGVLHLGKLKSSALPRSVVSDSIPTIWRTLTCGVLPTMMPVCGDASPLSLAFHRARALRG